MARAKTSAVAVDFCELHDRALARWYRRRPTRLAAGNQLVSLCRAQHVSNFNLWNLEDQARRTDLEAAAIVQIKRAIDGWNQTRNDLIERIDEAILAELSGARVPGAEQHSETAGQMIDRLSILALKIWHMAAAAAATDDARFGAECRRKLAVLEEQRRDLHRCLRRLLVDFRAGRRYFKLYRQFKAYNDPRLNPALAASWRGGGKPAAAIPPAGPVNRSR